jgi:hypothetical protein
VTDPSPDPLETFNRWADDHPKCPEYVGLSHSEAFEAARRAGRAEDMRILNLDPGHPIARWHMNLNPNRLNLVVRDGTVIAAALF